MALKERGSTTFLKSSFERVLRSAIAFSVSRSQKAHFRADITRRELASVLHGLRLMQEQWEPKTHGCTSISLHDPLELSEPNSCDHFCDEKDSPLSPAEIEDLCERLNMEFCN